MRLKLIIFVLLIIQVGLLFKLSFTAWPEMIVRPYLILKGWLPYRDFIMEHNFLLLVDLAVFNSIFGVGLPQLKIYTWVLIVLTDFTLFLVTKKLWNSKVALVSLLFYIPMQIIYNGNGLWFDLSLAPFALLIFYFLKRKKYFLVGVFWALSFLIKQTAFWFILPIFFSFFDDSEKRKFNKINSLFSGIVIVFFVSWVVLAALGIASYYFKWSIKYGIFLLPRIQGVTKLPSLKEFLVSFFPYFIFLPFLVLKKGKEKDLILWAFFSLFGIFPRFELFHFQPSIPFLSIVFGLMFFYFWKKTIIRVILILYLIGCLTLFLEVVVREWGKEDRFWGEKEKNISFFVKSKVKENEKIYVLNYWDSLYAMTNTLPVAKPLVPFLPWYLDYDNLKESIIKDVYLGMPRVIVKGDYNNYGLGSYKIPEIDKMIERYYTLSFRGDSVSIFVLK